MVMPKKAIGRNVKNCASTVVYEPVFHQWKISLCQEKCTWQHFQKGTWG